MTLFRSLLGCSTYLPEVVSQCFEIYRSAEQPMKSSLIGKASILVVIVALTWAGCGPGTTYSTEIRHVLLISMDTTRADVLGCYGFKHDTTPSIDALAREGILFENTYAPTPLTLPSHSTLLTGTIPPFHGAHDNQTYRCDESNVTLAEILKENGFTTGAIVGSIVLDGKYGLDQGFDYYDDDFQEERNIHNPERLAEETKRIASKWLEEHKEEKIFLFLHFFDPHRAYLAPEPFLKKFLDDPPPDQLSAEFQTSLYAGEVAYTDHCIKGIIDKLKDLGLYESTLIIITADHGEMLYEHNEESHGYFIYQGSMRIPLVFKVPGVSTPRRVKKTVGLVDVAPTVCSLLDLKGPFEFQGVDISSYLLQAAPKDLNRAVYLESLYPTKYKGNSLLGIVNDRYKYIQTTRPELYDLATDEKESVNLVEQESKAAFQLKRRLKQMLDDASASDEAGGKMDHETVSREQLEALGYVSGAVIEDFSFGTSRKDPKDLIEYHRNTITAQAYLMEDMVDEAKELYEDMIAMQPDVHDPYLRLATIANQSGDYPEAIRQLKRAIQVEPEETELFNSLASVYKKQDNHEQAIANLKKSLEIDPEQFEAHGELARIYYLIRNFEQAFFHSQESIRINSDQSSVLKLLAALYGRQNKTDKAIEYLKKSLQVEPGQAAVMTQLGTALYGQGKIREAMDLWSGSLKIEPNQVLPTDTLAWIKATSKIEKLYDPPEALTFARRACELTKYRNPDTLVTLAAAFAANGRFDDAVETISKAIDIATATGQNDRLPIFKKHLNLYRARQALRQ